MIAIQSYAFWSAASLQATPGTSGFRSRLPLIIFGGRYPTTACRRTSPEPRSMRRPAMPKGHARSWSAGSGSVLFVSNLVQPAEDRGHRRTFLYRA